MVGSLGIALRTQMESTLTERLLGLWRADPALGARGETALIAAPIPGGAAVALVGSY